MAGFGTGRTTCCPLVAVGAENESTNAYLEQSASRDSLHPDNQLVGLGLTTESRAAELSGNSKLIS